MKETVASLKLEVLFPQGEAVQEGPSRYCPLCSTLFWLSSSSSLSWKGEARRCMALRPGPGFPEPYPGGPCCAWDSHGRCCRLLIHLLPPGSLQKGVPALSFPNMGRYGPLLRPRCPVHRQAETSPSLPWESPLGVLYRFPTTESHQSSWFSLTWFPPPPWLFCLEVFLERRSLTSVPFRLLGRTLRLVSLVLFFQAWLLWSGDGPLLGSSS